MKLKEQMFWLLLHSVAVYINDNYVQKCEIIHWHAPRPVKAFKNKIEIFNLSRVDKFEEMGQLDNVFGKMGSFWSVKIPMWV